MTASDLKAARMSARAAIVDRLKVDLIGPSEPDERLTVLPSDRYLTGILFPVQEIPESEDDSEESEANAAGVEETGSRNDVPLHRAMRPSSFGLSFRVKGSSPSITVELTGARYVRRRSLAEVQTSETEARQGQRSDATKSEEQAPPEAREEVSGESGLQETDNTLTLGSGDPQTAAAVSDPPEYWERLPVRSEFSVTVSRTGFQSRQPVPGVAGFSYSIRVERNLSDLTSDLTLVVTNETPAGTDRASADEASLFQASLRVTPVQETEICPRPLRTSDFDEEARSNALLYRHVVEYAAGHVAAAQWSVTGDECTSVGTTFLPQAIVTGVSPSGSEHFRRLADKNWQAETGLRPLSATWLAQATPEDTFSALQELEKCYREWIDERRAEAADLLSDTTLGPAAQAHLLECADAAERIAEGIEFLRANPTALIAFQSSMAVMARQRGGELVWRPFQLGFQLLTLSSVADPASKDRERMDLLWFPTGGGKTEAYLGLIAFVALYRRLSHSNPDDGAGTAVLMRYTLRLLTTQQFQRAAAVICHLEQMRVNDPKRLGNQPFGIGLWVGGDATPNRVVDARRNPAAVRVITKCPLCGGATTNPGPQELRIFCREAGCLFRLSAIPTFVIDEEVYRERPTLLIGTADKFAQITRYRESGRLFGLDGQHAPPDLIIQDELHLISGPLGTISGLYEIAIDAFCSRQGHRPKVVGSTATIRRAESQVKALFDRSVAQFPPPGLNASDSGFSTADPSSPGRMYVGLTSAGRSPKFTLQAASASLAQSPQGLRSQTADEVLDPYWTQVMYFNSLRELGGALVLVEDDVRRSIADLAKRRNESERSLELPTELTSRVQSGEIPGILDLLATALPESEIDVVLASNMISVGVDVPRLGMMVVMGQPKTTAEYIQATSRVGRGDTPGLVVVVYNAGRPRDRSRFETFATWHSALYRDVEATSVTPFAPRARDKALHAVMVAMLRLLYADGDNPGMSTARLAHAAEVVKSILRRVQDVDPQEVAGTQVDLDRRLSQWRLRKQLDEWWWNKFQPTKKALLVSAEEQAASRAVNSAIDAWETPNSMREVEPSTRFRFATALARDQGGTANG